MKSLAELKQSIPASTPKLAVLNSLECNYRHTQCAFRPGDRRTGRGLHCGAERAVLAGNPFSSDPLHPYARRAADHESSLAAALFQVAAPIPALLFAICTSFGYIF